MGEATTPLVDKVVGAIKADVSAATAKSCRSVISGVMGLAVRYGAVSANPVREVERIESQAEAAASSADDWTNGSSCSKQLQADEKARRRDLPDLVFFMLATGVRIGEALARGLVARSTSTAGTVQITSTLVRVKGEGLLRKGTKSRAGERTLPLPVSAVAMLRRRFMTGARLDQPLFPDVLGGFRDPANVRRELREAQGHGDAGVDHLAHVPEDGGDDPRRGCTVGSPGRRPARAQPAVDDPGRLPGPARGGLPGGASRWKPR